MNLMDDHSLGRAATPGQAWILGAASVGAFHLAQLPGWSGAIVLFLAAVWWLALRMPGTKRQVFYGGLVLALCCYAPPLSFFWTIFSVTAVALWLVVAFWVALFFLLARQCRKRYGPAGAAGLIPWLWLGCEYFRSELYYLRFSWLAPGYAWMPNLGLGLGLRAGLYGSTFLVLVLWTVLYFTWRRPWLALGALVAWSGWMWTLDPARRPLPDESATRLRVAGVQLEFPTTLEVLAALDRLTERYPEAQLLVLSEYTCEGPVHERVRRWCAEHERWLLIGGKELLPAGDFYNMLYVVDPKGKIVFRQAKCVPIQFFKDGKPAREQQVWASPWGKLGLCVCYDLSYSRVTDRLIRQGAQALLVPTMDVEYWGAGEHELHARVAPVRAAEYGVPIFRLASSGISQLVDCRGHLEASAPFPGPGEMLAGELALGAPGRLPLDRWLVWPALGLTALTIGGLLLAAWDDRLQGRLLMNEPDYVKDLRP